MWTYHFYSSVHWLPFMGIFINSNTRFVKSLGMLKSTALQKSLIPFSSLSLSLPGPLGTSYILLAYQCHSGGKVGHLHSCSEAGSTLSFLNGNCLYFKKKKQPRRRIQESLLCSIFAFHHPRIPFHLSLRSPCWCGRPLFSYPVLNSRLSLVESVFTYWNLLVTLSRVPKWNVIGMVFNLFRGNDGHLETGSRRNQVVRRLWQIWKE